MAQRQSKIRDIAINKNAVSYLGFGRSDNRDNIGSDEKKDSNEGSPGRQSEDKKNEGRKRKSRGDDSDGNGSKGNRNKDCKKIKEKCPKVITTESGTQTGDDETNSDNEQDKGTVTGGLSLPRINTSGEEFLARFMQGFF